MTEPTITQPIVSQPMVSSQTFIDSIVNRVEIGDIMLQSANETINQLTKKAVLLLKDKSVQDYLRDRYIQSKKIIGYG